METGEPATTAIVPVGSQRLYYHAPDLDTQDYSQPPSAERRVVVDNPMHANLIGSLCRDGMHRPVLDIDLPCQLLPSSTPGHFHLYIDLPLDPGPYMELLQALADAGVVSRFYAEAAVHRGQTFVRPPWVKKPPKTLAEARERQDRPLSPDERSAIGLDPTPAADWTPETDSF